MQRFGSAPVFRRTVCAMIDQELGQFEFESRCCYMERRVAAIHIMPDLRKKYWEAAARDAPFMADICARSGEAVTTSSTFSLLPEAIAAIRDIKSLPFASVRRRDRVSAAFRIDTSYPKRASSR